MAALILIGASLVCAIAALFGRRVPTEQEIRDDERLRKFLWLPGLIVVVVASIYAVKRFDGSSSRSFRFPILIVASFIFAVLACVALSGFGVSAAQK
jgi:cytochrome bd-type quinol oxidase subunit 2